MTKFLKLWIVINLFFAVSLSMADSPQSLLGEFSSTGTWEQVSDLNISAEKTEFVASGADGRIIFNSGPAELSTHGGFGDAWVKLEFMLTAETQATFYLQSRYGLVLSDIVGKGQLTENSLGGLLPRLRDDKKIDAVAPSVNAAKSAGEWQQLEIKFRAPRYDEANNKTDNAFLLEVKLNGKKIHNNILMPGFTLGSKYVWEERYGPMWLRVTQGAIAIRNMDVRHADFEAVIVPAEQGKANNNDELMDFVTLGKDAFTSLGCEACHAVEKNDPSTKSGPNLFGLFGATPRDREVIESAEGHRFTIKTDRTYLHNSVRSPDLQHAIYEEGGKKGETYLPIMPAYSTQVLPDKQLDAIGAYLATLNNRYQQGPVIKLVTSEGPQQYEPLDDSLQFLVSNRVRTQRGAMAGLSARSIHVGQPNGIHYSFDPRLLAVANIWQGGFLDVSGEWTNRGGGGLKMGFDSRVIDFGEQAYLVAPLNKQGAMIDFSFKEAIFNDFDTIAESLNSKVDHLDRVRSIDAQFLGYEINSKEPLSAPTFRYRVGQNRLALTHELKASGDVVLSLTGQLTTPQKFAVNQRVLHDTKVSVGEIRDGVWSVPAGVVKAQLTGNIQVVANPWKPKASKFDYLRQPVKQILAQGNLPPGYSLESYFPPKDNYARPQLFEALGMTVTKDGTIVVATRTAGVWRIVNGEWRLFAEGIFDSLGVVAEDKQGLVLVVGQKAELTRLSDTNGDGLADKFDTLYDAHSFHGNYHTYLHGPALGGDGAYYFGLNLAHADQSIYKAGGAYMGSFGGLSGWAIRVTPKGESELWANGLRSPAGFAAAPDGKIWYADNQGEYVGTSKLFELKKGGFYGHPSSLIDLPGMTPDSPEIAWDKVSGKREHAVVLFPHNIVANSPGHPAWDTTAGKFGAFAGQIFIGDQTQSNLLRVVTETVNGVQQGVVIPFADGMESGVMRPVFLPDGSLLLGQTGRGWQAKGGHVASLQHLVWDGKTTSQDLLRVSATSSGFALVFTQPLAAEFNESEFGTKLQLRSWVYRDAPNYGSDMLDERDEVIKALKLSKDRKTLTIALADLQQPVVHPQQTARVYYFNLPDLRATPSGDKAALKAYYTLYSFPAAH